MSETETTSEAKPVETTEGTEADAQAAASPGGPAAEAAKPTDAATAEAKPDPAAEAARLRDQLLRTAADFDNFRKRSRREIEDAQRRGREGAIKELLPVFDNLERAAVHAEGATDAKAVADGLRIVLKQFLDTLDKMGVKRVPAVGQPFDPAVHEAIQHLESADHPAGVIMAEVQPGYSLGDRLIRAAMVVVSKGPPAASS
ncbi:MAG TPA: nucleotide exchange factor GrpE [Minicystis sp.]|nr:nucleotide exchange factor GrpE [Minicystis sp.]